MVSFPITTFTPNAAQQELQSDGLQTLGLTAVTLGPRWSSGAVQSGDYDPNALTLNITNGIRSPWKGIREYCYSPARATLSADLTAGATTVTVNAGQGNAFPAPQAPGSVILVLSNSSGTKREVVNCTARAGDMFTIQRAWDSTAAQAFSSSDRLELKLTGSNRTHDFFNVDGAPLTGSVTAIRLHPQAAMRLERLASQRFDGGNPVVRPIPVAMVIRAAEGFRTAQWYEADEALFDPSGPALNGVISFHDNRGLIVDPLYVASMLSDLLTQFLGLLVANAGGPANGAGGVTSISTMLASATVLHFVSPHGGAYQAALPGTTMVLENNAGVVQANVPSSGVTTLPANQRINAAAGDQGRLRWGFGTNGTLARTPLTPPALPGGVTMPRQFLRVCVVDTQWHLLGNRTNATVLGVGPDDEAIPESLMPKVRDQVVIDYLVDGPDVLGEGSTVLARPNQSMVLIVSPEIDGTMSVPAQRGANAHWPAFPAPNTNAGFATTIVSPAQGIQAALSGTQDVVVTIAGGVAPDGATIRIYPRVFVEIPAITEELSFERGDGASGIVNGANPTAILLRNPLNLFPGQAMPNPANLVMDIVVAPRTGTWRMFGNIAVTMSQAAVAAPPDSFTNPGVVQALPDMVKSICPVPLFGMTRIINPAPGAPATPIDLVRKLASEGSPREGPRLPTMVRFESVIVTGTTGPAVPNPAGTLLWDAVISGGRWSRETRSALHAGGNPGNPGGPDVHAPGVRVTGALAWDAARHAARRVQSVIPLPGAPTPSWVVFMGGNNFNEPVDNTPANTGTGAFLQTIAAVCETPELSALNVNVPAENVTVQQIVNDVANRLNVPPPNVNVQNGDRLINEVRREFFVSKKGLRDALWSLRRAIQEARELVYIESPAFSRTARPGSTPEAWKIDLVALLAARMQAFPSLRVIICTPKIADFAPKYKGWNRRHYAARLEAVGDLLAVAPDRVVVFHPVGFPGRTAFIRTTSVIVDDVYALVGTSHFRRRGMTFDGAADVVSFDRQFEKGYSKKVREYRRDLMAAKLAVPFPAPGTIPVAEYIRLGRPAAAFDLISDLLSQNGLGRILPLWPGPSDNAVLPATDDMADPDGANGATFIATLASLLSEAGD